MKRSVCNASLVVSAMIATVAPPVAAQTIERLTVANGAPFTVNAIASDSDVFVGVATVERLNANRGFRRLSDGSTELLPWLDSKTPSYPTAVSGDGTIVVGHEFSTEGLAFVVWMDGKIQELGPVVPPLSFPALYATGGTRTVGAANVPRGDGGYDLPLIEWNGLEGPDIVPPHWSSSESFVSLSGDGAVLISNTTTPDHGCIRILRRRTGEPSEVLPPPEGCPAAWAERVSADGGTIVGWGSPAPCPAEGGGGKFAPPILTDNIAYLWPQEGAPIVIPMLAGATSAAFTGVSNNGTRAVGLASVNHPQGIPNTGFIWTPEKGTRLLEAELALLGVDLAGWSALTVDSISGDGSRLYGRGQFKGLEERFVVRLGPDMSDSDDDGICNDWEENGIPYTDAKGQPQRYMLPQADPLKKNVWVEVDTMASVVFSVEASTQVGVSFANAPLDNPDRSTGVLLHVQHDETELPFVSPWLTNGSPTSCWPVEFYDFRTVHYGTSAERLGPGGPGLLEAKAKAFRYCIAGNVCGPQDWGGCGELPGDNFVIFLPEGLATIDAAAVFMHELGHNLGLGHGGCDNINGKPNHPSIMNYVHSYRYDWNAEFWRLDYSRAGSEEFGSLDETQLDEWAGIGTPTGIYKDWHAPFGFTGSQFGFRTAKLVKLNGTSTDFGSLNESLELDGKFNFAAQQDLNSTSSSPFEAPLPTQPSFPQVLHPCNDWDHMVLATAAMRGSALGPPQYPTDELRLQDIAWINANFPKPPPDCGIADLNCDGQVNGSDLGTMLAEWGTCARCQADLNLDGVVNGSDLGIMLAAWGPVN